jgi:threonine/homoserine/homoserine lactone efflux protein
MNAIAGVIGILTIAAITPGPNNVIVMNAGAQRGARAAAGAIAGVIVGSLALFFVAATVWSGMSARMPLLADWAALLGAAYLAWLGVSLFRARNGADGSKAFLPASPPAIAAFQFLNPKAWGLMAAVVAGSHPHVDGVLLVPVMIIVFATCLTLWAAGGVVLSRYLEDARTSRWFNRLSGACLIVFALGLPGGLVTAWGA